MRVYLCGDTAHDLNTKNDQVKLNMANGRKEEGWKGAEMGCGGIQYDRFKDHYM